MKNLYNKIEESVASIFEYVGRELAKVEISMILGSGLGVMADQVEDPVVIPYSKVKHFPRATVAGHTGEMVIGRLRGRRVVVMRGRVHFYEGYSLQEVTFPVRVMKRLGATRLLVTNAAGGMNPAFKVGDLMVIRDHINLTGSNPLIGPNDERLGPRFPAMAGAYDEEYRRLAFEVASELGISLQEGVYCGLAGPSYETPAEIKFLTMIGGDAVGMSTVPEVLVARHGGMRVLGISCITNILHQGPSQDTHQDVISVARQVGPHFMKLVKSVVERMP